MSTTGGDGMRGAYGFILADSRATLWCAPRANKLATTTTIVMQFVLHSCRPPTLPNAFMWKCIYIYWCLQSLVWCWGFSLHFVITNDICWLLSACFRGMVTIEVCRYIRTVIGKVEFSYMNFTLFNTAGATYPVLYRNKIWYEFC